MRINKSNPVSTNLDQENLSKVKAIGLYDIFLILFCLIGVGIAGYLSYTHFFSQPIVCTEGGGCETVNSSEYAKFMNIPVALLGLLMYLTLLTMVVLRWNFSKSESENGLTWSNRFDWLLFIASLFGVVFSGYLISMSLFVIQATCIWCIGSATTMTILFLLFATRLWRSVSYI